ncbi:uncharacterized protein [Polyergus mexicanus]|uniref:uncharacterized protein n=1 Tax=Polyergus mexicanus TaxID=615972 RepID=UPI0038B6138C
MFRQIQVHPNDWDLQRILWVDDQLNIIPYQLTTVTYGIRSAPFLAVRVLLQLVEDEGRNYSLAVPPLLKGRYVDDICGSADTLPELTSIAHQLLNLCKAGGFPLAKWQSNHPKLFQALPMDGAAVEPHSFDNTQEQGLQPARHHQTDYTIRSSTQLFDPLGFLSPVIIRAKTLLQELWLEKWMSLTPSATVELHGFSDVSQLAMTAAVYIKVTPHTTEPTYHS